MLGDGVNDVLALKQSDLGVAMGGGASAARSAAQVVLLDSRFAALPSVVAEGRRVIGNIERVGKLFITKTVYACLLALAVGVARLPFPFFPRHLTIVSSLTIGIPGFFLALSPSQARAQRGFTGRILRSALPMGTVAASATFLGYALARDEGLDIREARTVATFVLFGMGIWVLSIVVRPATRARVAVVVAMIGLFLAMIVLPGFRVAFDIDIPRTVMVFAIIGVIACGGALLEIGWHIGYTLGPRRRAVADDEET
jgi:cation-transporting ATPase E